MAAILKIFSHHFLPFISNNKCTNFQVNSIIIRDLSKGGGSNQSPPTPSTIGSQNKPTLEGLSRNVPTNTEIKVSEKGLHFAPIQGKLNELELRKNFKDFCRRMRLKCYFRDEPAPFFSEQPSFSPKSSWGLPVGHPNLEVFLI